ncbi:PQQ-dependent sugar dehydrogenase [Piscinibacter koreensis]|uniref:PQQ-dependent sugar dehydrogenase n=1 Tax=Piscinibacter koreensis TaxID=2742824 RepID=A0A7Y6TY32_9BURK|nr:PQQ-dependent sugar dehydrogenase [Schlegelella koreensis]NUZ07803.1 PQQ-dependent sugar dehydrogenase [Schlegelella koreensis]
MNRRPNALPRALLAALALAGGIACAADDGRATPTAGSARSADCKPLETRDREASSAEPAFAGQTRACGVNSNVAFDVVVLARGLQLPWSVEPLPDGALLVTEKAGRMRIVSVNGVVGAPLAGVPKVDAARQGGLLDVALSPRFASDRTVFWSFSEPRDGGNGTSVARGVLSADRTRLEQVQVILHTRPTYANGMHFGSRLAFGPDGMLYVTMGERSDRATRPQAQQLDSHLGKVLRIRPDGSPAPGNPFANRAGALPEIWSYGHRNVQASAFDGEGRFWTVEHGPRGGDEVNLTEAGKNYGWPLQSYGIEYSGEPMQEAAPQRPGMEQPVYYWDPVIAPSGAQFYDGALFPQWRGSLFVGALKQQRLVRLVLDGRRVVGEEHLLVDRSQRIRDVRQGFDGALYLAVDNGEIWKLVPARRTASGPERAPG